MPSSGRASRRYAVPTRRFRRTLCIASFVTGITETAPALGADAANGQRPIEVTIAAPRQLSERDMPVSRTVLAGAAVERPGGLVATEAMVGVPGVLVQNRENQAQDVRLDVRGSGTRAAFGVRGIKMFLDGIPITLPDGQTSLDSFALTDIGRIETIRGPASILYANNAGGVVLLTTEPPPLFPTVGVKALAGAYGTRELRARAAGHVKSEQRPDLEYLVSTSAFETRGFRRHSQARSEAAHVRLTLPFSHVTRLRVLTDLSHAPLLEDPGALQKAEALGSPRLAAADNVAYDARESFQQLRSGLIAESATREDSFSASAWFNLRRFDALKPERAIELDRVHRGGSVRLSSRRSIADLQSRFSATLEVDQQSDDRTNRTNQDGVPVRPVLLRQRERVRVLGLAVSELLKPASFVSCLGGVRFDRSDYSLDDQLIRDGDQSDQLAFSSSSGFLGAAFDWRWTTVFANFGQSLENPTLTELTNRPDGQGGFNDDLRPQRATTYELGLRSSWSRFIRPELSFFRSRLRDELVPFEDETGRVYYRNAGRSHRNGLEVSVVAETGDLWAQASYTHLRARFERYVRGGEDLAGHAVPGIPPDRWALLVRYGREGLFGGFNLAWYAPTAVNDENEEGSPALLTTSLTGGYRFRVERWQLTLEGRLQNVLDRRQYDNLRVNALGRRYYEPAAGISAYGGLEVAYGFGPV